MRVVALKPGFYKGARKKEGDEFEVGSGEKAKWFAPVDAANRAPSVPDSAPPRRRVGKPDDLT